MPPVDPDRLAQFLATLRRESTRSPGQGIARFARFVRGGAGLATGMLSTGRRGAQAVLSERDWKKLESLVTQLGELKGIPMKMGQVLSTLELELPEEARRLFGLLQTQAPATPWSRIEQVVREDLGSRAEAMLAALEREPVSIASIGQVHRGVLPDGTEVAVKVRHPDIEEAIRSDLRGAALGTGLAGTFLPGMAATAREFVVETQARFLEECDYALEASRQQLFGAFYRDHPVLCVPEVFPEWSGARVLTSRWQPGRSFDEFAADASQDERDRAGAALFELYIATLYRHGVFHADPHPGNYVFRSDGRVVVFDYGCVRVFEPEAVRAFVALASAVRADERAAVCAALRGLGAAPSANDAAYQQLRRLLRAFFGPMLTPGRQRIEGRLVVDLGQVTRDKLALARLRLPGRLMFLLRIRFGLYAVLSRLGAVVDWSALEQGFSAAG